MGYDEVTVAVVVVADAHERDPLAVAGCGVASGGACDYGYWCRCCADADELVKGTDDDVRPAAAAT